MAMIRSVESRRCPYCLEQAQPGITVGGRRFLECPCCGLVFRDGLDAPEEAARERRYYEDDYFRELAWDQLEGFRDGIYREALDRIEGQVGRGRLLDVGCGEGMFLCEAAARGWMTWGTELSPYAARYASTALGREIFCGELYDASFPQEFFDVVTLWHVLEHVREPARYLAEIRRVIRPGGLLVIAVPNVDDLLMQAAYRIVRGRPLRLFSKEDREIHLYHFSARTIGMYLERFGFSAIRIGPDYGIVEPGKKWLNFAAVIPYHLFGLKMFNAIEAVATPLGVQRT